MCNMYPHSAGALALPSEFCGSCTSQLYRDQPKGCAKKKSATQGSFI